MHMQIFQNLKKVQNVKYLSFQAFQTWDSQSALISSFEKEKNGGLETSGDLPQVTQLGSGKIGDQPQY